MSNARELAELGGSYGSGGFVGMKNRIINGAMMIDQRNAGASYTNTNQVLYGVDRWGSYGLSGAVLTLQQVADAPSGFTYSFKSTTSTATTTNDGGGIAQKIEANNCLDLAWGTASAQPVAISFWVKSSVTGQHNLAITYYGSSSNQYYCSPYTVNSANTWEQKTVLVPGCTTGGAFTAAGNTAYMVFWVSVIGSSGSTTYNTANTWTSTVSNKLSGTVNIGSTLNATVQVTGVQLEKGSTATSFDYRPYGTELQLCQRYFETSYAIGTAVGTATETNSCMWISNRNPGVPHTQLRYMVPKRATAGVGIYSPNNGAAGIYNVDAATNYTSPAFSRDGTMGGTLHAGTSVSLGQFLQFHYTASAEL